MGRSIVIHSIEWLIFDLVQSVFTDCRRTSKLS